MYLMTTEPASVLRVARISLLIVLIVVASSIGVVTAGSGSVTVIGANDQGYRSLQAAIDDAEPGDRVTVQPGVYTEEVVVNKSIDSPAIDSLWQTIHADD